MLADTTPNRLYLQLVETALEDSIVTDDEAAILRILGATLGVQPSDTCLLYTSPSPRDQVVSRMPSSA